MRKFFHQISYTIKICTITALTGPLYGDAPYAANVMMLWPAGTRPSQQEQGHQQVDLNAHWQVQPHTQAHRGADMQGPCHPLHSMMRSPPAGPLTCIIPPGKPCRVLWSDDDQGDPVSSFLLQ